MNRDRNYGQRVENYGQQKVDNSHLNKNQVVFQSRLRISQSGIEMLEYVIPLGCIDLHVSTPIPDEGTDRAPVYVHVRPARKPNGVSLAPRPRRGSAPMDVENDEIGDEDDGSGPGNEITTG